MVGAARRLAQCDHSHFAGTRSAGPVHRIQDSGFWHLAHRGILLLAIVFLGNYVAGLSGNEPILFDPDHVLWAFLNGADGVLLGACPIGECHYGDGNRYAVQRMQALNQRLEEHGFDSRRLRLAFFSNDDPAGYTTAVRDFIDELGGLYVKTIGSPGLVAR